MPDGAGELVLSDAMVEVPNVVSDTQVATEGKEDVVVGLAFDDIFVKHQGKGHVERPARVSAICNRLKEAGVWQEMTRIPIREASKEELLSVHSKAYVRKLDHLHDCAKDTSFCRNKLKEKLDDFTQDVEDVYMNEHTVQSAKMAVGGCIEAVEAVMTGRVSSAVAIVRPPGHHAEAHCAQGFCIFNNVAIAAKQALAMFGLKRVLIVDWDIHHGNGTQRTFLKDERVMYFSVHRHDFGKFYPHSLDAGPNKVGTGNAAGTNINVAWNGHGMGDREYLSAWERVLLPIATQFKPELIIVSAGFDAAEGDKMGQCNITPRGYALLTHQLMEIQSRVVLVLEGGYDLDSLSNSVVACTNQLHERSKLSVELSNYKAALHSEAVKPSAVESINQTIQAHKPYWRLRTAKVNE